MAEVDTNVKVPPDNGLDTSLDEDLIDYDDEVVEANNIGANTESHQLNNHDTASHPDKVSNVEDQSAEPLNEDIGGDYQASAGHFDQAQDDGLDMDSRVDEGQNQPNDIEPDGPVNDEDFDMDQEAQAPRDGSHIEVEGDHDINLEYDNHEGQQQDDLDYHELAPADDNAQIEGDQNGEQLGSVHQNDIAAQQEHEVDPSTATMTGQLDDGGKGEGDENEALPDPRDDDEITWEDGDEDSGDVTSNTMQVEEGAVTGSLHPDDANVETDEAAAPGEAFVQEENVAASRRSEDAEGGDEYPNITVQYKGEEFPFFSTSSEGFFEDMAVLDESIETLLAGFRSELIDEVSIEEELVFQIDELGLEYSESSSHDSLSGVTLRQILEIFDLLVKNQDPDSSRALYTYLFTKSSTTKRFESLVESAAAGKGLDEVIQLFESPMPQGNHEAVFEQVDDDYQDMDEYESNGGASAEVAADHQEEGQDDEQNNFEEHPVIEDQHHTEQVPQGEIDTLVEGVNDFTHGSIPVQDEGEAVDSSHQIAPDGEADGEPNSFQDALEPENLDTTADGDFDVNEDLTNVPSPNTQAIQSEFTQEITHTDDGDNVAESSNTNGVTADAPPNGAVTTTDDDFAEIDWQEDLLDEENLSNASFSASKRPRAEDEPDVEEAKDVKRQKS